MSGGNAAYKDRLFSFIFGSEAHREWTLSLYNAVNGTHYTDPEAISIETIHQVLYMGMHNDVAFIIADELSLYEQQSTYNPNMPLRMLEYTVNLFEKHIRRAGRNKYSETLIELPVPRLVVFYNGLRPMADDATLHLSDSFPEARRALADISVNVRMININRGHSEALLEACPPLDEYAWIVDSVRSRKSAVGLEAAIDATIDHMPRSFLMKPYLDMHKAEVKNMLLTEYNEAETMEMFKQEWYAQGQSQGRTQGIAEERLNSIRSLMNSLKLTASQAMDALRIPLEERDSILKQL